jgi:acetyltransferase
VAQIAERGARGAVILSAGFRERGAEGAALERAVLDAAHPRDLRIVGPNCLGLLVPGHGINATFAHLHPQAGDLAFVSQSGAMVAAMLDWAADRAIGFSRVVSLGNMADVDIGDLLDDLALDRHTRAVLLYVEAIAGAREFMSAARAAARRKPVLVIKAGTAAEGARAAGSHTGALAGSDAVYDAAFRRAGMLRVRTVAELFDAATTLATGRSPAGNRLSILTNGGGPGVLATDSVVALGGALAELRPETLARLDGLLGPTWSRSNPVDVLGDAGGERYAEALGALLEDRGADAVLVLNAPSALASSLEAARAVAQAAGTPRVPVLASWLGGAGAEPARRWLAEHGVPSYATPEAATRAFLHLVEYRRSRAELLETPSSIADDVPCCDRAGATSVIERALDAGREWLLDDEACALLAAYRIAAGAADGANASAASLGTATLGAAAASSAPAVGPLRVGLASDATFGPIVIFGQSGAAPEASGDRAIALPPLNSALARHLIERTRVGRGLEAHGTDGESAAALQAIAATLVRVSQIAVDHGSVVELEIDPLIVDGGGARALRARVRVSAGMPRGEERLAIRPYPRELEGEIELRDGQRLPMRPIRPEDEPRLLEAFEHLSPEDVRLRFFSPLRVLHHDFAAQLTNIDYDRAMAFVVLEPPGDETSAIVGTARLTADADNERAEYAVTVRTDWQGRGLGYALMKRTIDYARDRGLHELFGLVLRDNLAMLSMNRELGFRVTGSNEGPDILRVSLDLRELRASPQHRNA